MIPLQKGGLLSRRKDPHLLLEDKVLNTAGDYTKGSLHRYLLKIHTNRWDVSVYECIFVFGCMYVMFICACLLKCINLIHRY